MNLFQRWLDKLYKYGLEYYQMYYGVYRGTCMDNEDPDEQGRIKVRVPAVSGRDTIGTWAWPMTSWAGRNSGSFIIPDIGDPVYVMFEGGKPDFPIWTGGWWPNVGKQDNFVGDMSPYTEGKPTKRIFKTKAGHELSFEDDESNLSCKMVWHDPNEDVYSFFAFTADGSIQMANHKGCFMEMQTADDEERVRFMDNSGNSILQNKNGTVISDPFGNVITMEDGVVQIISQDGIVINSQSINLKTGGVEVGNLATEQIIKGTSFITWMKSVLKPFFDTHQHPTGVGPSGVPLVPMQLPADQLVLTDKLKTE